jgi:hypothetical protein
LTHHKICSIIEACSERDIASFFLFGDYKMAFKFHRRTRFNYWSDSKLVHLLINKKPEEKNSYSSVANMLEALRSSEDHVVEKIAGRLQNIIMFPSDLYHSIRIYLKNSKGNTHVLDGGLEKGQWHDLCYRIPHCLFFELDKYITQEKGLENHKWEMDLTFDEGWGILPDHPKYGLLTDQAKAAIEQNEIWGWWKENKDKEFVDLDEETAYIEKETEMLIRLIKIRNSLWT